MKSGIRAHTVPNFYLGGFVAPESEGSPDPWVWLGSLTTGEIKRRSPKNISISRGLYDGPGGFDEPGASIEDHLSKIESAAAAAIRSLVASDIKEGAVVPAEVWRFLAWQVPRTPGWMAMEEEWIYGWDFNADHPVAEPPPEGFESIRDRVRSKCMENPDTGERRNVVGSDEFKSYSRRGWKWILSSEDRLEMLHVQAWYLQIRHFPRLSWSRLNAPNNEWFITSDRGVSWVVDGVADAPPSALKHPTAQVVAPLSRQVALVGRNEKKKLNVTPRDVNRFIAATASEWIVGPTHDVVEQAIRDRP